MMRYTRNPTPPGKPQARRPINPGTDVLESWARANAGELSLLFAMLPALIAEMRPASAQLLIDDIKKLRKRIIAEALAHRVKLPKSVA